MPFSIRGPCHVFPKRNSELTFIQVPCKAVSPSHLSVKFLDHTSSEGRYVIPGSTSGAVCLQHT